MDGAGHGVFCGDAIGHPVQIFNPHWNTRFCEDPEAARATRRRMLEFCADMRTLLFPTHFAPPHVVGVTRYRDAFLCLASRTEPATMELITKAVRLAARSEDHKSELQSLMRSSYAV